jgi:aspartyl-tRNA(Asn)/glutamyl-tRNA(Gln) amidotransferase subunit B
LVEIVSNPDFRTADEVIRYLEKLRLLLTFAGVSDCRMQDGSMRCDINISVRKTGADVLGTRTEIKNMNSLKAIARAIEFESQRHINALETGCETLIQETRRWDDDCGETFSMREKETAADYRYFPNPELLPVHIDNDWIERIRVSLPEPAHEKFARMTEKLGLPENDCRIITGNINLSRIFEETLGFVDKARDVVTWITGELLSIAKAAGRSDDDIIIDCERFAQIIRLVDDKTINRTVGKKLLIKVFEENIDPLAYIEENKLGMVSDEGLLEKAVSGVLLANEKSVNEYRNGSRKVFGYLVGQVMRSTGGRADPKTVNELLEKALNNY